MKTKTARTVPKQVIDAVQRCARGTYQAHLLSGMEAWSGATIASCNQWGARYAESRWNLVARIDQALGNVDDGLPVWGAESRLVLREQTPGHPRWTRRLVLLHGDDVIDWLDAEAEGDES